MNNPMLTYVMQADPVQIQIQSLTTGTSSSHNRIRTSELADVLIPVPQAGSEAAERLMRLSSDYADAVGRITSSAVALAELSRARNSMLGPQG